jgi:DNA replication ATP-dependent helicase Dna2
MAYTNRAVDEICGMLVKADIPFLRIGSELSCDPQYQPYLLQNQIGDQPRLSDMQRQVAQRPRCRRHHLDDAVAILSLCAETLHAGHHRRELPDPGTQHHRSLRQPSGHRSSSGRKATAKTGAATSGCDIDKFILIGDYKQLPAVVQQNDESAAITEPELQAIGLTSCKNSLFERLIRQELRAGRTDFIGTLHHQGRMHPEIADFPGKAFYARGTHLSRAPAASTRDIAQLSLAGS